MQAGSARTRRSSIVLAAVVVAFAGAPPDAAAQAALADAVAARRTPPRYASLLAQNAEVDAKQGDGATALHWAAYRNDAETATALIRAGADVRAANDHGVTPLALGGPATATPESSRSC